MTGTVDWMAQRITEIEQAAAEKELQRILKLLEGLLDQSTWTNTEADYSPEQVERIIALIKGENK